MRVRASVRNIPRNTLISGVGPRPSGPVVRRDIYTHIPINSRCVSLCAGPYARTHTPTHTRTHARMHTLTHMCALPMSPCTAPTVVVCSLISHFLSYLCGAAHFTLVRRIRRAALCRIASGCVSVLSLFFFCCIACVRCITSFNACSHTPVRHRVRVTVPTAAF